MSQILLPPDGQAQGVPPEGGRSAPLLLVIVVTLLASGVLSSDPEPSVGPRAGPTVAPGAMAAPAVASTAPVEDQGEFVEFGFDSQVGMVPSRGARAGAAGPENSRGAVRQGAFPM